MYDLFFFIPFLSYSFLLHFGGGAKGAGPSVLGVLRFPRQTKENCPAATMGAAMIGLLLAYALCFAAVSVSGASAGLVNAAVSRLVDLREGHTVQNSYAVQLRNDGDSAEVGFRLAFTEALAAGLSTLEVFEQKANEVNPLFAGKGAVTHALEVRDTPNLGAKGEEAREAVGVRLYDVALHSPLKPGESRKLFVSATFVGVLSPLPAAVGAGEDQLLMYEGDTIGFVSPYPTEAVQTMVQLPGSSSLQAATSHPAPESSAPKGASMELKYAQQRDVPPWDVGGQPLVAHFRSNLFQVKVDRLVREISVSHWSALVNVEEYYSPMRNGGAAWKGEFVRRDYQSADAGDSNSYAKNSFPGYLSMIPPYAYSIWLRDSIGNISTSVVRPSREQTTVQVNTRYPLLGGWASTHVFGYSLPLSSVVKAGGDGRFQATVQFGSTAQKAVSDELVVRVVLPLGATDVSYAVPFGVEELPDELTPGPLTYAGRRTLVLRKINASAAHTADFVVFYRLSILQLLRQPMWLGGWVLLGICSLLYLARADWRISRKTESKAGRDEHEHDD